MLRGINAELRGSGNVVRGKSASWNLEAPLSDENLGFPQAGGSEVASGNDFESGAVAADDTPRVRAFRAAKSELGGSKFVFGVPMSHLVVQVHSFPVEMREALESAVALQLEKNSPYAAEEMTIGYEILQETDRDLIVFAAGLPEDESDKIRADAELAGCEIVRVDIPILGWFRAMLARGTELAAGGKVLLVKMNSVWNILIANAGVLVCARSVSDVTPAALAREVLLTVQTAEALCGALTISGVVLFAPAAEGKFEDFVKSLERIFFDASVSVRELDDCYLSAEGLAQRAMEAMTLDLTPQSWKTERRIRKLERRVKFAAIGISSVALCVIAALLAGPFVYEFMAERQRNLGKAHASSYKAVSNTRAKVRLIESYTDRSGSALEMLRMASDAVSEGITFTSFSYRRHDAVKISGEAETSQEVYQFKDKIASNPIFVKVDLTGPSGTRSGKQRFEITATLQSMEEGK